MLKVLIKRIAHTWRINRDPVGYARSIGVQVGEHCRLLGLTMATFGSEPYLVKLGNHVSLTSGVRFVTHDGGVWIFREQFPEIDRFAPIVVGDNVFIGLQSIILPGVTIGDNCVIGAGSIVTKDIPSGWVAAGVPARCLKTVDQYWEGVQDQVTHIRSRSQHERRRLLEERFGLRPQKQLEPR